VDPKGMKPEQSQATHYIDDTTAPEWDRVFNFIVAKPYSDVLELRYVFLTFPNPNYTVWCPYVTSTSHEKEVHYW
jgi:hypothetical protein